MIEVLALGWLLTAALSGALLWAATRYPVVAQAFEALWLSMWGVVAVVTPAWHGSIAVALLMAVPFTIYVAMRMRWL
jgi:hypothetical protein